MKYLLYSVWFLLWTAGCVSHDGYVLTGNVPEGWEGRRVELLVSDVNTPYVADSAVISGGKFQLKGKFAISRYCKVMIYLDPSRQNPSLVYQCPVYLDSMDVRIDCGYSGDLPEFQVTGSSVAQQEYEAYRNACRNLERQLELGLLGSQYREAQYVKEDETRAMELAREMTERKRQLRSFRMQYIKDHPDSPVSFYVARELCERQSALGLEEMEQLWSVFPAGLQSSEPGKDFRDLFRQKKVFLGQPFLDMELATPEGEIKKISDYVIPGHYTLLEFWASWCTPCREEIPYMKEAYAKYHSRGFDIVSVSIDVDPEAWKKALAQEQMPWIQLQDWNARKYPEKSVFRAYEGGGVPYSIMLDDEGKVIDFNARGGWLNILLCEKFD